TTVIYTTSLPDALPIFWNYIKKENIQLPSIYFSHDREVLEHEGQLIAVSDFIQVEEHDKISTKRVRYRTVGDMTCTAAVESRARSEEHTSELQSRENLV